MSYKDCSKSKKDEESLFQREIEHINGVLAFVFLLKRQSAGSGSDFKESHAFSDYIPVSQYPCVA